MFAHDLAIGIERELRVLRDLQSKYPDAHRIEGKHSEYDIEVPGKFTVEVKYDPASQRTGNIVVEYYHRKASDYTSARQTGGCSILERGVSGSPELPYISVLLVRVWTR